MKRKQQILKAVKLCGFKLNIGYDFFGDDYVCRVLTLWTNHNIRVLAYKYMRR